MLTGEQETQAMVIAAGGTGGHVFPGVAIGEMLASKNYHVHWFGTSTGIEQKIIPKLPFKFYTLNSIGLRNKNTLKQIKAIYLLLISTIKALFYLKKIRPKFVLGMGGYISVPVGVAATLLKIPLVIHEQNSIPGLANKSLAKFSRKILTGFPEVFISYDTAKFTGNPVRINLCEQLKKANLNFDEQNKIKNSSAEVISKNSIRENKLLKQELHILVLGGSLGARQINEIVPKAISKMKLKQNVKVCHQTGVDMLTDVKKLYTHLNLKHVRIEPFIDDIASAYDWADLVITRSGALTVSEIATVGLASVLIPYPFAVDNHQMANANWLVALDAAIVLDPNTLTVDLLSDTLDRLSNDDVNLLSKMAINARNFSHKDALSNIVQECLKL